jgi:cytochrome c oxidase assembly factor CtaG
MGGHLSDRLPVGDEMTAGQLLQQAWDLEPSVIIGSIALFIAYLWVVRFRMDRKTAFFGSGVLLMLLDLIGPLDFLGDDYLFSAHMLEHIILYLGVPPLLLLGVPADEVRSLLSVDYFAKAERFLRNPVAAWLIAVLTLWVWHIPALYNAALDSEGIHAIQHLCMLVSGTIFWWPVFTPLKEDRITPIGGFIYIFLAMCANMILGILLTFSPLGFYPVYMRPSDGDPILIFIRSVWKIYPQPDLNLGGLFMWIIGGLIYFAAMLGVISRLFRDEEDKEDEVSEEPGGRLNAG